MDAETGTELTARSRVVVSQRIESANARPIPASADHEWPGTPEQWLLVRRPGITPQRTDSGSHRNAIEIVPLVVGSWYAWTVLQSAPPAGATATARAGAFLGLCGALAAIAVGSGIHLQVGEFDPSR